MKDRKIEAMYGIYGKDPLHHCASCHHLAYLEGSRRWYKCRVYGISNADSTDWRVRNIACGMWGKPLPTGHVPVLERLKHDRKERLPEQLDGQLDMFGGMVGKDGQA